jgi:hypothetical protein
MHHRLARRCSGSRRRAGLRGSAGAVVSRDPAASPLSAPSAGSTAAGAAIPSLVSISSMASPNWATSRESFSDDWPNCMRRSLKSCSFSLSNSSVFSFSAS